MGQIASLVEEASSTMGLAEVEVILTVCRLLGHLNCHTRGEGDRVLLDQQLIGTLLLLFLLRMESLSLELNLLLEEAWQVKVERLEE
jgi:hypothetical protein